MKNLFKINPFKPIFKNWTFWFWLLAPLVIGLYIGRLIWIELDLSLTLKGYQSFLEFSKLPFSIMGLTFPCVGIYIFQYKSMQSSEIILRDKIRQAKIRRDKYLDSFISVAMAVSGYFNAPSVKNLGSSTDFPGSIFSGTIRSTNLAIGFTNQTSKNVLITLNVV